MLKRLLFVFFLLNCSVALAAECDNLIVNFINKSSQPISLTYANSSIDDNRQFNPTLLAANTVQLNPGDPITLPQIINPNAPGVRSDLSVSLNSNPYIKYIIKIKKSSYSMIFGCGKVDISNAEEVIDPKYSYEHPDTKIVYPTPDFTLSSDNVDDGDCNIGKNASVTIVFSEKTNLTS